MSVEEQKLAKEICTNLIEFAQVETKLLYNPSPQDVLKLFI